jgi:uncharacterized membrane protein
MLAPSKAGAVPRVRPEASGGLTRSGRPRIDAIDLLRGLVIALMVLDHVRDYFHEQAFLFNPTDPERTTVALFATRWITHLCAPTFVFLAGASAYLQGVNGKPPRELAAFLAARGAWLIALELTLIGFGFNFAPIVFLQVIYAIGGGMVFLAVLVLLRLPARWVGALGALIVAGHGLLAPIEPAHLGALAPLWFLLFEFGVIPGVPGFLAYPLVPWFGVMCLGYGLGAVFLLPQDQRIRRIALLGFGALVLFFVVRTFNVAGPVWTYGDPAPWRSYPTFAQSAMSFLNVSKYPPSTLYVLATLGTVLLLLPLLAGARGIVAKALLAFGRTPLFTYVLHIYLVHTAALVVGLLRGVPASHFANFILDPVRLVNGQWGFPLTGVYAVWLVALVALYPPARWFAELKRRRRDRWLSYL